MSRFIIAVVLYLIIIMTAKVYTEHCEVISAQDAYGTLPVYRTPKPTTIRLGSVEVVYKASR